MSGADSWTPQGGSLSVVQQAQMWVSTCLQVSHVMCVCVCSPHPAVLACLQVTPIPQAHLHSDLACLVGTCCGAHIHQSPGHICNQTLHASLATHVPAGSDVEHTSHKQPVYRPHQLYNTGPAYNIGPALQHRTSFTT